MKKIFLAGTAVAALMAGPALAADLGARAPVYKAAPPVMAAYNWSGFYIGAQVGAVWGDADYVTPANGFAASYNLDGSVIGGGHVGVLWQTGPWVLGVEGDINGSGAKGNDANLGGTLDETKLRWGGSVRGILGFAWDRWLAYGTGGWAGADINHCFNGLNGACVSDTHSGWTAGGGLKYAFAPNWIAGVEYRHSEYDSKRHATAVPAFDRVVGLTTDEVTLRLSYKFGYGAVMAAY